MEDFESRKLRIIDDSAREVVMRRLKSGEFVPWAVHKKLLAHSVPNAVLDVWKDQAPAETEEETTLFQDEINSVIHRRSSEIIQNNKNTLMRETVKYLKQEFHVKLEKLLTTLPQHLKSLTDITELTNKLLEIKIKNVNSCESVNNLNNLKLTCEDKQLDIIRVQTYSKMFGEHSGVVNAFIKLKKVLKDALTTAELSLARLQTLGAAYDSVRDDPDYNVLLERYLKINIEIDELKECLN